jgi:hypothetical protein
MWNRKLVFDTLEKNNQISLIMLLWHLHRCTYENIRRILLQTRKLRFIKIVWIFWDFEFVGILSLSGFWVFGILSLSRFWVCRDFEFVGILSVRDFEIRNFVGDPIISSSYTIVCFGNWSLKYFTRRFFDLYGFSLQGGV